MKRFILMMIVSAFTFGTAACGDSHDDDHGEESVEEEGCEHMAEGPAESVTGAAAQADAPNATFEHTRVDAALADDGNGQNLAYVNYEAAEAGEYLVFVNSDIPFAILDSSGADVAIENTNTAFDVCTEVAVEHLVDLEVGTYAFVWGPTDEAAVSYVVEEAGEHGDDHSE